MKKYSGTIAIILIIIGFFSIVLTIGRMRDGSTIKVCEFESDNNSFEIFYNTTWGKFEVTRGLFRHYHEGFYDRDFIDQDLFFDLLQKRRTAFENGRDDEGDKISEKLLDGQTPQEKIAYIKQKIIKEENKGNIYKNLDCSN